MVYDLITSGHVKLVKKTKCDVKEHNFYCFITINNISTPFFNWKIAAIFFISVINAFLAADTYLKLLDRAVSGARFLAEAVLLVIFLIIDPWQSCVCFIISGVTQCTLLMVLYLDRMCQHGLHLVLLSHISTLMHCLAAEPCSTAGFLFPSRYPSGTILLTPYSMVYDWQVSRAGPMLFFWPKLLYPAVVFCSFSLSLLSVYRLVLWGWGLWTDRVYITLSQPCTADLF